MLSRKIRKPSLALVAVVALSVAGAFAGGASAAPPSTACVSGTDYTTSNSGGYATVTFKNSLADCSWSVPGGVTSLSYLVVGGGGGGGGGSLYYKSHADWCGTYRLGWTGSPEKVGGGGAGGGGGTVTSGTTSVTPLASLNVRVGAGGESGKPGGCGSTGLASQITTNTADGTGLTGGTGGTSSFDTIANATGGTGGNGGTAVGGGAAQGGASGTYSGGTNTLSAADCLPTVTTPCFVAPGGAGASAAGSSTPTTGIAVNGGAGGAGALWAVNGLTYGGGGGGSVRHPWTQPTATRGGGAGGSGGGGAGALGNGTAGTDGLGGGGGGGRGNGSSAPGWSNAGAGGLGGRGTVIVRYLIPTPPGAPGISGAPDGTTSDTSAYITINGGAGETFTCSIDGGAYAPCTSPFEPSGLNDGTHTVSVKATKDGLESAPSVATWTVDLTPPAAPTVTLTRPSVFPTNNTDATITYSGAAGSTFTCSLDGGTYGPCEASPVSLTSLDAGSHTYSVKATDPYGNVSDAGSVTWTISSGALPPGLLSVSITVPSFKCKPMVKCPLVFTTTINSTPKVRGGPVTFLEYAITPKQPSDSARSVAARLIPYSTTIALPPRKVAFWVRVTNEAGLWSRWYRTRHAPTMVGW